MERVQSLRHCKHLIRKRQRYSTRTIAKVRTILISLLDGGREGILTKAVVLWESISKAPTR